jgi:hypothetical protein
VHWYPPTIYPDKITDSRVDSGLKDGPEVYQDVGKCGAASTIHMAEEIDVVF